MLEATPSLALLSLLKMALAGEHSSYKGDFFLLWENAVFSKLFCFLKALQKLFEKVSADLVQKVFQNMEQEEMKKLEISLQKILDNLG